MGDTQKLIQELSAQATPVKPLRLYRYVVAVLVGLTLYAVCMQCWLEGLRAGLLAQLARPLFIAELLLLVAMLVSAALAAVYTMLPDGAQRKTLMRLPYIFSGGMLALVVFQLFMPHDARMVMPDTAAAHTHECTLYIALSSLLPALVMFLVVRKGASVMPMQAGLLAVIASVSLSALTLRLSEANDDIIHLLSWHYGPSLFFAVIGAVLGRFLLRW